MHQEQARQSSKSRECDALSAGDEHVLAQLDCAAGDSNHDQGFDDAFVRVAELMSEDHRDPQHELDLLLERIEGLARDGADGEHGAETWRDRNGSAQRAGCRDTAARGTDERESQLMIGVVGMARPQLLDLRSNGWLATLHCVGESAER